MESFGSYFEYKVTYFDTVDDETQIHYGVLFARDWEEVGARVQRFYGKDQIENIMIWNLNLDLDSVYEFNGYDSNFQIDNISKK